jgi:hypothetical protein
MPQASASDRVAKDASTGTAPPSSGIDHTSTVIGITTYM